MYQLSLSNGGPKPAVHLCTAQPPEAGLVVASRRFFFALFLPLAGPFYYVPKQPYLQPNSKPTSNFAPPDYQPHPSPNTNMQLHIETTSPANPRVFLNTPDYSLPIPTFPLHLYYLPPINPTATHPFICIVNRLTWNPYCTTLTVFL
jgi:hypothetical protein